MQSFILTKIETFLPEKQEAHVRIIVRGLWPTAEANVPQVQI